MYFASGIRYARSSHSTVVKNRIGMYRAHDLEMFTRSFQISKSIFTQFKASHVEIQIEI